MKLQDYTAVEKDEVVVDCELSKDVVVMWYHNEAEVKASKMVTIKAEGKRRTLVIKKVTDQDKGQFMCDCGTDKTTATLHIEGKHAGFLCVCVSVCLCVCVFVYLCVCLCDLHQFFKHRQ